MKSSTKVHLKPTSKILGVDPGLGTKSPCGLALFTLEGTIIDFTKVWTDKNTPQQKRLNDIALASWDLGKTSKLVCIESTVMRGRGGESLQRLVGAITSRFPKHDVKHVQNTTVKRIVGGTGQADKAQVASGVLQWFKDKGNKKSVTIVNNLIESEDWDILDALAIGIAGM
jgi:Holliday junction resolvasome RuvABC endonuclease subunit